MQLKQINIAYQPVQDRLLVRISTSEQLEFRLWLTRRLVAQLLPAIAQLFASRSAELTENPQAQAALQEFQSEAALQQAKFSSSYDADELKPATTGEPLLIHSINMRPLEAGHYLLLLQDAENTKLQLRMDEVLLQGCLKLLRQTQRAAGWGLGDAAPPSSQDATAPVQLN